MRRLQRWIPLLLCCVLALPLVGCELTRYLIKAGNHYANNTATRVKLVTATEVTFSVLFDDSARYQTRDPRNQGDINKLYGFSDCTSHHQQNSARFGWRWLNERLEIHAYTYVRGERQSRLLGTVPLDEPSEYGLRIEGGQYLFTLNGETTTMPRGCDSDRPARYQLFPYFGGDEVAPHDITILIEEQE